MQTHPQATPITRKVLMDTKIVTLHLIIIEWNLIRNLLNEVKALKHRLRHNDKETMYTLARAATDDEHVQPTVPLLAQREVFGEKVCLLHGESMRSLLQSSRVFDGHASRAKNSEKSS